MKKFSERIIYELAVEMLKGEMEKLSETEVWTAVHYTGFEKLCKVYSILKDDMREDMKSDIWNKLTAAA